MAAEEVGHRCAQIEAQEEMSRVGQHHHEGHQRPLGAADGELAEVRPVDLRLLARQGAQPQVRLGRRPRALAGHDARGSDRGAPG